MKNNLTLNHNYRRLLLIHLKFNQFMKLELTINDTWIAKGDPNEISPNRDD